MKPICILRPDDRREHAFAEEILKAEGIFFFEAADASAREFSRWQRAPLILLLSGCYDAEVSDFLLDYVQRGGSVVAFRPPGPFVTALGLRELDSLADARVRVLDGKGLPSSPENLLCPGRTSGQFSSSREETLAEFCSDNGQPLGSALWKFNIGKGKLYFFCYDPVASVIALRYGSGKFDQCPEMAGLGGPRHINAFVGLSEKYSKKVPLADIHQDVIREIIFQSLDGHRPLPRIWYYPDAARGLFFIKSDGCGEAGIDTEVALAEAHDAKVTFYRGPQSAFGGQVIREWRERGHGMSMEVDINEVTYGRMMSELDHKAYDRIRALISEQVRGFTEACGFECGSTSIHSCQWTGAPLAGILMEHGRWMLTHFVSHDPRMTKETYGPYTISSTLPMRYYDSELGLMDIFHQPAQYDESQAVGERRAAPAGKPIPGMAQLVGFTQEEYGREIDRFMSESVAAYHGAHIANFHPAYLDPSHPRTSHDCFCSVLDAAKRLGMPRLNLESWAEFVRARDSIKILRIDKTEGRTTVEMVSDMDIRGLTVLLVGASPSVAAYVDGSELRVMSGIYEDKHQRYGVLSLAAGKRTTLDLVEPA